MTRKTGIDEGPRRIDLVGTRKGDQLKDWPGCYCRPLDADGSTAESQRRGEWSVSMKHFENAPSFKRMLEVA